MVIPSFKTPNWIIFISGGSWWWREQLDWKIFEVGWLLYCFMQRFDLKSPICNWLILNPSGLRKGLRKLFTSSRRAGDSSRILNMAFMSFPTFHPVIWMPVPKVSYRMRREKEPIYIVLENPPSTAINNIDTQVTRIEYYTPMTQHGCNSSCDQDGDRWWWLWWWWWQMVVGWWCMCRLRIDLPAPLSGAEGDPFAYPVLTQATANSSVKAKPWSTRIWSPVQWIP